MLLAALAIDPQKAKGEVASADLRVLPLNLRGSLTWRREAGEAFSRP